MGELGEKGPDCCRVMFRTRKIEDRDINESFVETMEAMYDLAVPSLGQQRRLYNERKTDSSYRTYVAVLGDERVIGTATLFVEKNLGTNKGPAGHIWDVCVHQDFQGQKVGKVLMEDLILEAKYANCYKVILDCYPSKSGFYEKLGFKSYGQAMRLNL